MNFTDAKKLLPTFQTLHDYHSEKLEATVESVFITLQDPFLAKEDYKQIQNGYRLPLLDEDAGHFTIVVALSNGLILSAKKLVELDQIENLQEPAAELSEMHQE